MKIHFFQRYHSKENVDTANAMLLLSRLYSYSPNKFYSFLGSILPENANIELAFKMQEKIKDGTIPDATITQPSFKVVVETKLHGQFGIKQLTGHLSSFKSEDYKVLITLDPKTINSKLKATLDKEIISYNSQFNSNVVHHHLTFEELSNRIYEVIDERDYEMHDVLEDYREYCYTSELIPNDWKRMRVQLAGTTIETNKMLSLYYDNVDRGFSGHKYLGLYNKKSVRAIGEVIAVVTAIKVEDSLLVEVEKGSITDEMKQRIYDAIHDGKNYGYNLQDTKHRYFFVDEFFDTNFEKETKGAPRGSRMFDLCDLLDVDKLPDTKEIAKLLKTKTWK